MYADQFNKVPGGGMPMGQENPGLHGYGLPPAYTVQDPSGQQVPPPYDFPMHQQLPGYPGYPVQPGYPGQLSNMGQAMVPNPEVAHPPGPQGTHRADGTQPPPPQTVQPQGYVIVPNVTVVQQPLRTPDPVTVTCPSCQQVVVTKTSSYPGTLAWLIVGGLFLAGLVLLIPLLFCFVPLCIPSCHDVRHRCPNCKANIYTYTRL